jgi:general secretion pathway protein D
MLLYVRGTVSHDHRYVTLSVRPQLATVVQPIRRIEQFSVVQDTTGDDDTGDDDDEIVTSAFIEAPEVELTQVETTVTVPDKGTLLLGGQRLVGEGEVEAGVPIFSKIPILNRVFTNRSRVKDERTLLMLIKPTIIIQNEQEDELFPGLRENPTTYNIGRTGAAAQ